MLWSDIITHFREWYTPKLTAQSLRNMPRVSKCFSKLFTYGSDPYSLIQKLYPLNRTLPSKWWKCVGWCHRQAVVSRSVEGHGVLAAPAGIRCSCVVDQAQDRQKMGCWVGVPGLRSFSEGNINSNFILFNIDDVLYYEALLTVLFYYNLSCIGIIHWENSIKFQDFCNFIQTLPQRIPHSLLIVEIYWTLYVLQEL